ncbi:MAG TPA: glycoside hydrolase family 16 protein, partial [Acidimicrobiia bacterium]|nr:glycoside hydrolase family 16 protein [Acidimicrobiia bacterium]
EDRPERSGEICVAEVFGETILDGWSEVGIGVKRLGDTALAQEFSAHRIEIDVSEFHTYGVEWRPGHLEYAIDGQVVSRDVQAPDYPMQLMIGVFDFPAKAHATDDDVPVPELIVSHVRGRSWATSTT